MSESGSRWKSWSQGDRIAFRTQHLTPSSRWLYRVDHYSSQSVVALLVVSLLVVSVGVGAFLHFRSGWVTLFEVGTSVVTLMMVLAIQHTQGREQAATQRKLDELLRALPEAESGLMLLEEASDRTIQTVEQEQRESRENSTEFDQV